MCFCCPGENIDCSGHGTCNSALHECGCYPGWTGDACDIPDCPGPDCNHQGICNVTLDPPRCTNCQIGWMGKACDEPCVNGTQSPPESGVCVCHPCYAGKGCNSECSGSGKCSVDGTHCECDTVHRGSLCEIPGCPGEKHDCSLHGSCNSADHVCMCMPGECTFRIGSSLNTFSPCLFKAVST